jgi:hypothetical protein
VKVGENIMNMKQAMKLNSGDIVTCKITREKVKVLEVESVPFDYRSNAVMIKGLGEKQGFNTWHHKTIF